MLKIRLMGTRNEILWFQRLLYRCPQINIMEVSEIYENKGTCRYFRSYMEIEKIRQVEE